MEPLGVIAERVSVGDLSPEARRRPQLTDHDVAVEEIAESAAVIQVRVGQSEGGEVRSVLVQPGQRFGQAVDDRGDDGAVVIGGHHVPDVDLQNVSIVDHDGGRIAGADRPENHAPLGKVGVHHPLPLFP